jgi:hypothetical protein
LLKDIAHVILFLEIADTLATDDSLIPMACYKLVKAIEAHGLPTIINEGGDTMRPLQLPFKGRAMAAMAMLVVVMIMIVMLVTMAMWVITLMLVVVMIVVMMMVFFFYITFYLLNPSGGSSYLLEIKAISI